MIVFTASADFKMPCRSSGPIGPAWKSGNTGFCRGSTPPRRCVVDGDVVAAAAEERFNRREADRRLSGQCDRVLP